MPVGFDARLARLRVITTISDHSVWLSIPGGTAVRRDQRQRQKQKKQERKNARDKKQAQQAEKRLQYPKVVFDDANGDPEFVEAVRTALGTIDFGDSQLFSEQERDFFRVIRKYGGSKAIGMTDEMIRSSPLTAEQQASVRLRLWLGYGTRLLERIPEDTRRRFMPFNDVFVEFRDRAIVLKFSSLLTAKGVGGTSYFSRRRPTVEFDGQKYIIAFSRHAIERICERVNPRYIEYAAAGDVYSLFADCVYVEPILLHGGQPAFVLYATCGIPPFTSYRVYVENVLGETNVDPAKGKCYYRVGYCPVAIEGEFAKAKTLLFPGYTGTPEYGLIMRSGLTREEKDRLIEMTRMLDANQVLLEENYEAIKWFHNNGVPQVVQMTRQVFAPHAR